MNSRFSDSFVQELDQLFRWRRDVRHFRKEPVEEATLDALLETACLAPSVGLSEPWIFVRVDDRARREAVRQNFLRANQAALAERDGDAPLYARLKLAGLDDAPHHVAVFCDPNPAQGRGLGRASMPETAAYSAVMAIYSLWLAARAKDIGVGWVSILDPTTMNEILGMDRALTFVGYLCVGYPRNSDDTPELQRMGWEQRNPARRHWVRR